VDDVNESCHSSCGGDSGGDGGGGGGGGDVAWAWDVGITELTDNNIKSERNIIRKQGDTTTIM